MVDSVVPIFRDHGYNALVALDVQVRWEQFTEHSQKCYTLIKGAAKRRVKWLGVFVSVDLLRYERGLLRGPVEANK